MEIEDNAIYSLSLRNTHRHWILINRTAAWNCYKCWNRDVQKHTEIGFFSNTLTSCSWENGTIILTCAVTTCGCESRPAASSNISPQLLEAPTAARIIFRVLIYSSPIFEKPSFLRTNLIFPPFTCDRVNSGARQRDYAVFYIHQSGPGSGHVCVYLCAPSHVSSALFLISFVDICHLVKAWWDCSRIFITVFGVCVTVFVGRRAGLDEGADLCQRLSVSALGQLVCFSAVKGSHLGLNSCENVSLVLCFQDVTAATTHVHA